MDDVLFDPLVIEYNQFDNIVYLRVNDQLEYADLCTPIYQALRKERQ